MTKHLEHLIEVGAHDDRDPNECSLCVVAKFCGMFKNVFDVDDDDDSTHLVGSGRKL